MDADQQVAMMAYDDREIARGIQGKEYVLHLQPQVDMRTGTTIGFEALARWQHPSKGLVGPADFIPKMEESNQITDLTYELMNQLLAYREHFELSDYLGRFSLNVSPRSLLHDGFADQITALVESYRQSAEGLVLEVTETQGLSDSAAANRTLAQLAEAGFELALDDFGVGYSSFSRALRGVFREIKIDRAFVARIFSDKASLSITSNLISFSADMGWRCVAEGVEDQRTAERLLQLGCTVGQGYLYAPPLQFEHALEMATVGITPETGVIRVGAFSTASSPEVLLNHFTGAEAARHQQQDNPVWVVDIDRDQLAWSNASGLKFWGCETAAGLAHQSWMGSLDGATQRRIRGYRDRMLQGAEITRRITVQAQGRSTTFLCVLSGRRGSSGEVLMVVEAMESNLHLPADELAAVAAEAVEHPMALFTESGVLVWSNTAHELLPPEWLDYERSQVHGATRSRHVADSELSKMSPNVRPMPRTQHPEYSEHEYNFSVQRVAKRAGVGALFLTSFSPVVGPTDTAIAALA